VESTGRQHQGTVVAPPDHFKSKLSLIQRLLRVELLKDDPNAVCLGLDQLATLCSHSEGDPNKENRAAVFRSSGAARIALAMEKWYAFPTIQYKGCQALETAACQDSDHKRFAKDNGAIDAVLWAMESYPNDVAVQVCGCGALSVYPYIQENAKYICQESNGAVLIVAAMNRFKENADLQKRASRALASMLKRNYFKSRRRVVARLFCVPLTTMMMKIRSM